MRIRLLAAVANDPKGAVLDVSQDRATRLIRTGYAVELKPLKKKDGAS